NPRGGLNRSLHSIQGDSVPAPTRDRRAGPARARRPGRLPGHEDPVALALDRHLLLAKCARNPRPSHVTALTDDPGLALALGLTALPRPPT
ncbi:hypothetical protein, partial [Rhodococcus koreensis]